MNCSNIVVITVMVLYILMFSSLNLFVTYLPVIILQRIQVIQSVKYVFFALA